MVFELRHCGVGDSARVELKDILVKSLQEELEGAEVTLLGYEDGGHPVICIIRPLGS